VTTTLGEPRQLADGTHVRVRRAFSPGHFRTPAYVRGKPGTIVATCGRFPNPEELAYGRDGLPKRILYRVRFRQVDLWHEYAGNVDDALDIDLYDHWLEVTE
jgi:nitrile hydratase